MWPAGTLCITIAANIADSGVLTFDACFPDSVVGLIVSSEFTDCRYFEYFLRTAKADLHSFAPSTAQKNINLSILRDVMIPLPPLKELNRIVARVDELMAVCDQLEAALESAQWERGKLLEALLYDSLGEGGKVLASIEPTTSTV
jgi:type I restriction enzyme S subunit